MLRPTPDTASVTSTVSPAPSKVSNDAPALTVDPVYPTSWVQVRDALKAGYKPPIPDPVPPPPKPVPPGDGVLVTTPEGFAVHPPADVTCLEGLVELAAVRRCVGGPLRNIDTPYRSVT